MHHKIIFKIKEINLKSILIMMSQMNMPIFSGSNAMKVWMMRPNPCQNPANLNNIRLIICDV